MELPTAMNEVAADDVLSAYPWWGGTIENGPTTAVSSATIAFDSGLDPSSLAAGNTGEPLSSLPYVCDADSLGAGEQLDMQYGFSHPDALSPVTLGYDSSRHVAPVSIPPGGADQTVSITVTPRDASRYGGWNWFSVFIDGGLDVVSMTGPSNLDQGEMLETGSPDHPSWNLGNAVLDKTYTFVVVFRYADRDDLPLRLVPAAQIFGFTDAEGFECSICSGPTVVFPIPALDGDTPGSGMATFSVDGASFTATSSKTAYTTLYPNEPGKATLGLPTGQDQCKKDGWRAFEVFKNQGDCVSFLTTKGKNLPAR